MTQHDDHPPSGGLLHHLLTLTLVDITSRDLQVSKKAVIFFCRHLLSPIASIFGSEVLYAARTFLSHKMPAAEPEHYFLSAKIIQFGRIRK